jgi:hypothetical protein
VAAALGKALPEVEDNIVGIDQEPLRHIFERQDCAKTLALR